MGGVNNSHALRLLASEQERLEGEKEAEVEEVRKRHADEMDQHVDDLTREIVSRIAGQLLDEDAPRSTRPPVARAIVESAPGIPHVADASEAPAEEPDEEEALTFDEPYIETLRCTTCNECTQINGQLFAYNENKQAYIKDAAAGTFKQLVDAAALCPVKIIHPGKPKNPDEPDLDRLIEKAAQFN